MSICIFVRCLVTWRVVCVLRSRPCLQSCGSSDGTLAFCEQICACRALRMPNSDRRIRMYRWQHQLATCLANCKGFFQEPPNSETPIPKNYSDKNRKWYRFHYWGVPGKILEKLCGFAKKLRRGAICEVSCVVTRDTS